MSATDLPLGTELVFAENREVESIFKTDKYQIVDHVWTSCKPTSKFSSSTPTVTARRIQMVRVQLQSNPRLMDAWGAEPSKLKEDDDENYESDDSSSPDQNINGSNAKKIGDKSSSCSAETEIQGQYSADGGGRSRMSQKASNYSSDASASVQNNSSKKRVSGKSSDCSNWEVAESSAANIRNNQSQPLSGRSSNVAPPPPPPDVMYARASAPTPQEKVQPWTRAASYNPAAQFVIQSTGMRADQFYPMEAQYAQPCNHLGGFQDNSRPTMRNAYSNPQNWYHPDTMPNNMLSYGQDARSAGPLPCNPNAESFSTSSTSDEYHKPYPDNYMEPYIPDHECGENNLENSDDDFDYKEEDQEEDQQLEFESEDENEKEDGNQEGCLSEWSIVNKQ